MMRSFSDNDPFLYKAVKSEISPVQNLIPSIFFDKSIINFSTFLLTGYFLELDGSNSNTRFTSSSFRQRKL